MHCWYSYGIALPIRNRGFGIDLYRKKEEEKTMIGLSEIILIVIIAIIFLKPDKLPEYVGAITKVLSQTKDVSREIKKDIGDTLNTINEQVSASEEKEI